MAIFLLKSLALGLGLAMDASAVSMANGFSYPKLKLRKIFLIAIIFGLFQGIMPLIGYFVGFAVLKYIEDFIPWIALIILGYLGIKMIVDGVVDSKENNSDKNSKNIENVCKCENKELCFKLLFTQAIATSIDALSVGLTIADYTIKNAIIAAVCITVVTFIASFIAVFLGKKFGTKLGNKAIIIGGIILIIIGLEIFITGII